MTIARSFAAYALVTLVAVTVVAEIPPRHPFPQNLPYVQGSLRPDHRSVELLNSDVKFAYRRWRPRYLRQAGVEADGHPRYRVTMGNSSNARTVSEGQGYGMIIVALMAGEAEDARTIFDGLWEYFNDHRSSIDNHSADRPCTADGPVSGLCGCPEWVHRLARARTPRLPRGSE